MVYKSALHEAFCALNGAYVPELPAIVWAAAASPFLPDRESYEGTNLSTAEVLRVSAKYQSKYCRPVDENSAEYKATTAANIAAYGNEWGYLG
jgi:hypothetical protein